MRYSAQQALAILQNIPSDESGDEENDNEEDNVDQTLSSHTDSSSSNSSDSEENNILPLRKRLGKTGCSYSFSKRTGSRGRRRSRESVKDWPMTSDEHQDEDRPTTSEEHQDEDGPTTNDKHKDEQSASGKDGTTWQRVQPGGSVAGRFAKQNILRRRPGPTAFATTRVSRNNEASAFRLFFNEPMLRYICKCTSEEGKRVKGSWSVEPAEMDTFIGLVIARGVSGGRTLPLKSMWSAEWGNKLFSSAMPRDR